MMLPFQIEKIPPAVQFTNRIYTSEATFQQWSSSPEGQRATSSKGDGLYVRVGVKQIPYLLSVHKDIRQPNVVGFNAMQREVAQLESGGHSSAKLDPDVGMRKIQQMDIFVDVKQSNPPMKPNEKVEIDNAKLEALLEDFALLPFCRQKGHCFVKIYEDRHLLELTVENFKTYEEDLSRTRGNYDSAILRPETLFNFKPGAKKNVIMKGDAEANRTMFTGSFNFEKLGIGGLDSQAATIFRRAFLFRCVPRKIVEEMNQAYVRGMMLYGPPGTGKTLIARKIAKVLDSREPIIKAGPDMLNKYVGESESKVRELFAAAEAEQAEHGANSKLHVIIIDEIDAIVKQRGMSASNAGVGDSIVNALLAKIDGVEALDNVLLIGMTNRLDMIDEALLRPGRFEVKIEIGLPDEAGREQILKIHTTPHKDSGRLGEDVDLKRLAALTKNYTGAEIKGLITAAGSHAFGEKVNIDNLADTTNDLSGVKVMWTHLMKALRDVPPAFGSKESQAKEVLRDYGIIDYSDDFRRHTLHNLKMLVSEVRDKENGSSQISSVILSGKERTGLSALACHAALEADFPFMRFLTASDFIGYTELGIVQKLQKIFQDAYKTEMSCIILDDLDKIIQYTSVGMRFSNTIMQAVWNFVRTAPPQQELDDGVYTDKRIFVFGTTHEEEFIKECGLASAFTRCLRVDEVQGQESLRKVLNSIPKFQKAVKDPAQVDSCLAMVPGPIGMKQLILNAELAAFRSRVEGTDLDIAFGEAMSMQD